MRKATLLKIQCYWVVGHERETAIGLAAKALRTHKTLRKRLFLESKLKEISPELLKEARDYNLQLIQLS